MSVICVFFVKQKTAYEVRISDWSSDVCSSDLLLVLDRRPLGVTGHGSDHLVEEQLVEPGVGAELGMEGRHEHRALAAQDGPPVDLGEHIDEIGRASCRERGCQYV